MSKETIERWMPSNLAELRDAVQEMVRAAYDAGEGDLDVVYVDVRDLALERQTLTDGSTVLNVVVRENK